ncbi:MAG TPA: hypothetical protein VK327_01090, partial [Candidatus Paceibacterota bacterium]|nr:hypothetical protein [Candidatus Paceibacterota bacterium]
PAGLANIVAVAAGFAHCLALKNDGTVTGWGYNGYGQLNIPSGLDGVIALAGGVDQSLALKSDGTLVAWGHNDMGQGTVPAGLSNVVAIACGSGFNVVRLDDGTVCGWGIYQPAHPFFQFPDSVALSAGGAPITVLRSNGSLVSWDYSTPGNVTTNTLADIVFIGSDSSRSLAVDRHGKIFIENAPATEAPTDATNVVAVAGGILFDVAVIQDFQPVALSQLRITGIQASPPNLRLDATGTGSGTFYVFTSTNLSLPLAQWRPVATNSLSGNGAVTIMATNAITPDASARYYILSTVRPATP